MNRETKGLLFDLAAVGLGVAVATKLIVDRDWRKEAAYTGSLEGRGDYGRGKVR